jgi:hypothetical protein
MARFALQPLLGELSLRETARDNIFLGLDNALVLDNATGAVAENHGL